MSDEIHSRAALPDGVIVDLYWDRGDCVRAEIDGVNVDLLGRYGREVIEAWLDERTEDEDVERDEEAELRIRRDARQDADDRWNRSRK